MCVLPSVQTWEMIKLIAIVVEAYSVHFNGSYAILLKIRRVGEVEKIWKQDDGKGIEIKESES